MNHLSFYWLPENNEILIKGIETEFAQLIEQSISTGKISLPPIPDVVLQIQRLSAQENTSATDIADCLIEDPSLAAIVIRVANSVIFNRRSIICTDLVTAVARLGIHRVRDIVTAQSIEQLKQSVNLSKECNYILINSAATSRELAATMVMVTKGFRESGDPRYKNLENDKALLTGLLADIGLFCIVNEYYLYLERGNYLDENIALQIFSSQCSIVSKLVLEHWGFDSDFVEVATNERIEYPEHDVTYLDIARIANHVLMFRRGDEDIDEHEVEFDVTGADILYRLTTLGDLEFRDQIDEVINACGL